MCLRSRDGTERLYSDKELMHVGVHELAHIGTLDNGYVDPHLDPQFKALLRYLEKEALANMLMRAMPMH